MKILIKAADFVVAFLLTIAASSMIISMFLQVVFRFVFNSPLYWTEERGPGNRECTWELTILLPNCRNRR